MSMIIPSGNLGCVDWDRNLTYHLTHCFNNVKHLPVRGIRFGVGVIGSFGSRIGRTLYKHSIFAGLDEKEISEQKEKNQHLTLFQQFKLGVKEGGKRVPFQYAIALIIGIHLAWRDRNADNSTGLSPVSPETAPCPTFLEKVGHITLKQFGGVYREELVFRMIIHTSIELIQNFADWTLSRCCQNRIFKKITSAQVRVFIAHLLFAIAHTELCFSGGSYSQCERVMWQAIIVFCTFPTETFLRETTVGLVAPFSAHLVNNLGIEFLSLALRSFIASNLFRSILEYSLRQG